MVQKLTAQEKEVALRALSSEQVARFRMLSSKLDSMQHDFMETEIDLAREVAKIKAVEAKRDFYAEIIARIRKDLEEFDELLSNVKQ